MSRSGKSSGRSNMKDLVRKLFKQEPVTKEVIDNKSAQGEKVASRCAQFYF